MDNDLDLNIDPDSSDKKETNKPDIEELAKSFSNGQVKPQDSENNLDDFEIPELGNIDTKSDAAGIELDDINKEENSSSSEKMDLDRP